MKDKHVVFLFDGADRIGELTERIYRLKSLFPEKDNYRITVVSTPIDQMPRLNRAHYNIIMRGLNLIYLPSKFMNELQKHFSIDYTSPYFLKDNTNLYPFSHNLFSSLYYQKNLHKNFKKYYSLSNMENETGKNLRKTFGIPQNAKLVTLHVREASYLNLKEKKNLSYHDYRNASIENYIPAVNYLIENGFYVVRIGDRSMTKIRNAPKQFIDIHFHKNYTTLADTYFVSQSTFMIAGTSGPDRIALRFGVPVLNVNQNIHAQEDGYDNCEKLVVYKKYYSKQLKRNLTLEEILLSQAFYYFNYDYFELSGIELIENTPDEILVATKEMLGRLAGKYSKEKIENYCNKRIKDIYKQAFSHYSRLPYLKLFLNPFPQVISTPFCHQNTVLFTTRPKISIEFLIMNPDLLGHEFPDIPIKNDTTSDITFELPVQNKILEEKELFSMGRVEDLESELLSGLQKEPFNKFACYNLGLLCFHKQDYQNAIVYYKNCLSIDPYFKPGIYKFIEVVKITKQFQIIIPYLRLYIARNHQDQNVIRFFEEIIGCIEQVTLIPWKNVHNTNKKTQTLISRLKQYIKQYDRNGYKINKPHRNLIVSEIPGSGLYFFSKVFNLINNFICFDGNINNIRDLPSVFHGLRKCIRCHKNLNRSIEIELTPDLSFSARLSDMKKMVDEDVVIGLNLNYVSKSNEDLNRLFDERRILYDIFGYRLIGLIRDPVSTIIYWNRPESSLLHESNVTNNNLSSRWKGIKFNSFDKYDRQAQIWELYASEFLKLRGCKGVEPYWDEPIQIIKIYTYEQLKSDINWVINDCCDFLSIPYIHIDPPVFQIDNCEKHQDIDRIKESVRKYCVSRHAIGYEDISSKSRVPGFWNNKKDISTQEIDYQKCL